jgi:hypothetical protein
MNARDPDVKNPLDLIAHNFGGDGGFIGHSDVRCSGSDYRYTAAPARSPVAPHRDCPAGLVIFGVSGDRLDLLECRAIDASDEQI